MKKVLVLLTISFVFVGCTEMRFSRYDGSQRSWPVIPGSMAETRWKVPVYRTWPNRPYEVVGMYRHINPDLRWNDDDIRDAATQASRVKADAIILRQGVEAGVTSFAGTNLDPGSLGAQETTVLVIKWKSDSDLSKDMADSANIVKMIQADGQSSPTAAQFALRVGYDCFPGESRSEIHGRVRRMLAKLEPNPIDLNGFWIFECVVTSEQLNGRSVNRYCGVARSSLQGSTFTILTQEGTIEINLVAQHDSGQISGKLGVGTEAASQIDGVATPGKISVTGRGRSRDGLSQISLILVR